MSTLASSCLALIISSRSLIKCVVSSFVPDDGSTETLFLFAALVLPFRLPFDRTDLPDLPALVELQPPLNGAVEAQVLAMEVSEYDSSTIAEQTPNMGYTLSSHGVLFSDAWIRFQIRGLLYVPQAD